MVEPKRIQAKKKLFIHCWSTLIIYLLAVYKKNNNSLILVYFCQRSQAKLFLQNLQKNTCCKACSWVLYFCLPHN
jgi:hypothetical protein